MSDHTPSLLDIDSLHISDVQTVIANANAIENGETDFSSLMENMILCPVFFQESSRTYINATVSFARMGGTILPLNTANTRVGSDWNEPIRDFCALINACCDYVIVRCAEAQDMFEFAKWCTVPMINGGNGVGRGSEHPMQALIDLFVIQKIFGENPVKVLMVGGKHIRTTRTQFKLFRRLGYTIDVVSPPSHIDNGDMDSFYSDNVAEYESVESADLSQYDILYHNGMDEDSSIKSPEKYVVTLAKLQKGGFGGVVMHSLPRLNELDKEIDDTDFNMYYAQMSKAKFVFQSVYHFLYERGQP